MATSAAPSSPSHFVNAYHCSEKYTSLYHRARDRRCKTSNLPWFGLYLDARYFSLRTCLKRFRQRILVGPTLPMAMPRRAATSA
jgi:hypothetical protein